MYEFKFPDLGEGLVEGEVVKWHVSEGQHVNEGDPLVDVMTEKATVTLPAPTTGVVQSILVREGERVKVGQVLCIISEGGAKTQVEAGPQVVQRVEAASPPAQAGTTIAAPSYGRVRAMPAARRLARELGIDLSRVPGSGPGGVITLRDVRKYAEEAKRREAVPEPVQREAALPEERVPVRGLRRAIAEKMSKAKSSIPHAYHIEEVDMTEIMALRDRLRPKAEALGVRLTLTPFIVKAAVAALMDYPYMNASFDEERGEIVVKRYYNIGLAVDTEDGLVVVVVKDADKKTILEIAKEAAHLAEKARNGRLELGDVRGSTFTISNIGPIGGVGGIPIVNYPEAAIMAVGQARRRPVAVGDGVAIRNMAMVTVSFDHRVVDGAYVARFTNRFKELIEEPDLLVLRL